MLALNVGHCLNLILNICMCLQHLASFDPYSRKADEGVQTYIDHDDIQAAMDKIDADLGKLLLNMVTVEDSSDPNHVYNRALMLKVNLNTAI